MAFQTEQKTTLWMGELEQWMDENYIRQLWFSLGENVNVKMIRDKVTGAAAGYCFVDFSTTAGAMRQLNSVNGTVIPGTNKVFKLNWASGGGMNTFQSRYGSVKSGKVVTDPATGMSRGYGFVRFSDEMDQQRAMSEMNGQYCGSRPMRIASATPKNKPAGSAPAAAGGAGAMGMGAMGMGMQGMGMGMGMGMMAMPQQMGMGAGYYQMPMQGMPPQGMQQHHQQQQQAQQQQMQNFGAQAANGGYNPFTDPSNTTVFIGGLNPGVSDDDLKANFAGFGEILHTKIPPGRGCGFVTYAHRQSAEMAIQQMNNAIIGGARVRLSWGKAQPSSKPSGSYGAGANGASYLAPAPGTANHLGNDDPIHADPVDRLNETFISQKEGALERIDIEGTGWRGAQKQIYAQ
ncbi:tRNA selenocysteine 1-associated protein 1 [Phlyctochytrium planicorne]|nr:tRNA selenocysteine 1-associated protein 1 [Phlyctochytrium planicorne]